MNLTVTIRGKKYWKSAQEVARDTAGNPKMKKTFPKILYGTFMDGGTGPAFLQTDKEIASLVGTGETAIVGVYKLIELKDAGGVVVTKTIRKVK